MGIPHAVSPNGKQDDESPSERLIGYLPNAW